MPYTYANLVTLSDDLCSEWNQAVGTNSSGYGVGHTGDTNTAYGKAGTYMTDASAVDIDILRYLASANAANHQAKVDIYNWSKMIHAPLLGDWTAAINAAGSATINNIEKFAKYWNYGSGGPWHCLMNPIFREIHFAVYTTYPSASNVFYEVLQGSRFGNALGKLVGSTFTDGVAIDSTKYAGGVAYARSSGSVSGSPGTISVTGVWRKTDGTTATGVGTVAWGLPANPYALTPPFTNALLLDVTNITCSGSVGADTVWIEAWRPTGRPTFSWEANL